MRTLIVFALLVGCGDDAAPSDAGSDAADASFDSAVDGDASDVIFSLEIHGEPWSDGQVVDWEFGFQGGTMIVPLVVFEDGVTAGETVEFTVRHAPDPDAPELFGEAAQFRGPFTYFFEVRADGERLVAGPILDQLGWSDLDGMRLIHTVDVRAARGNASRSYAIEMETRGPSPCDVFDIEDGGCSYYVIPGMATVSIVDPDPIYGSCVDGQGVRLDFVPDDMEAAVACAETTAFSELQLQQMFLVGSQHPPASCLDGVGLTEGAVVPALLRHIRVGTCSPSQIDLTMDTSACTEMCR